MSRTTASVLLIIALFLSGAWIWMKLQTKAVESETAGIHRAMDQIAPDSTHKKPALQRVKDVTERARQQSDGNKKLLDSLTAATLR